ncbi:Mitochondrial ribosome-associated GTPase 2 [Merluccius polli]|uniref:Mitochondrial ribosome-associated GTPase 2 n=1 Tax=Merluccius polli TaxID=89951 RepID=A0AA47P374_MERPO|nr:Mitochondrial ribosome-associated GTPase 2 [Merluccius polli]
MLETMLKTLSGSECRNRLLQALLTGRRHGGQPACSSSSTVSTYSDSGFPKPAVQRRMAARSLCTTHALCGKARVVPKKKVISEKKLTRYFVDYRRVKLVAGSGGRGVCSFHSEPRKEWGGPDGGNGGDGGNIIIKVDRLIKSLAQVSRCTREKMANQVAVETVMVGTAASPTFWCNRSALVVKEQGTMVADLAQHGPGISGCVWGYGRKGNRFFLSNENRAPMTTAPAIPGQEKELTA